ncbi:hypothetical protein ElyMa_002701800 [Elysia marginata]|uniref:Mutator-like transposase domain-containing protein n=1 Tax=Elysia marginata TaxID=1093978 RepID=A0AAV4HBW2_9GAST|nr:hypothetical protein ElyMa_002701800 [Elysia marginata]
MEPVRMYRIFSRSEEQYGLKYSKYLGDGDSKSYTVVAEADPPLFEGIKIEKLECCGHVQKRMGKRLLDKVAQKYVMKEIKPVFEDLSSDDLLQRCLHRGTQNVSESFHHLVWERCPKSSFVGRDRLEIAVSDATIVFNEGEVGRCAAFEKLGLPVGEHQYSGFRKLDYQRVEAAQKEAKAEKRQIELKRGYRQQGKIVERKYTKLEAFKLWKNDIPRE